MKNNNLIFSQEISSIQIELLNNLLTFVKLFNNRSTTIELLNDLLIFKSTIINLNIFIFNSKKDIDFILISIEFK